MKIKHLETLLSSLDLNDFTKIIHTSINSHNANDPYVFINSFLSGKRIDFDPSLFDSLLDKTGNDLLTVLKGLNYSFRINNVHRINESINSCGAFHLQQTSISTACNLYFTPARKYPCLNLHTDPQHSFILQWIGAKKWSFPVDENGELVKHYRPGHFPETKGQCYKEVITRPGEVMYIPNGVPHKAELVGNEPSVHLNFAENILIKHDVYRHIFDYFSSQLGHNKEIGKEVDSLEDIGATLRQFQSLLSEANIAQVEHAISSKAMITSLGYFKVGRNNR